jgi:hypothetical protein
MKHAAVLKSLWSLPLFVMLSLTLPNQSWIASHVLFVISFAQVVGAVKFVELSRLVVHGSGKRFCWQLLAQQYELDFPSVGDA